MSNNDSWTPEEIARANERQREIIEAAEQKKSLIELKKSNSTQDWGVISRSQALAWKCLPSSSA